MHKFKVGDTVKVIEENYGHAGEIGTIRDTDSSDLPYQVEFEKCSDCWFCEEWLELVCIQVGDRVRAKVGQMKGQVGTVTLNDGTDYRPFIVEFPVEFPDTTNYYYYESELEKVEKETEMNVTPVTNKSVVARVKELEDADAVSVLLARIISPRASEVEIMRQSEVTDLGYYDAAIKELNAAGLFDGCRLSADLANHLNDTVF